LTEYLDLADYLLIAEAVLGVPAEKIARWPGVGLADSALHAPAAGFGGAELYRDVIDKAAVLCALHGTIHSLTGTSASPIWRCSSFSPETGSTGSRRRWT
jgi:death-on-curing protein